MNKKIITAVFAPVVAIAVLVSAFFGGCAVSSHDWFVNTIKNYYYYEVDEAAFETDDFKSAVSKYLDKYSAYYTAEEYKAVYASNEGAKSGIGISYTFVEGRGVYIASVTGNSPAYLSGMRAGEWLASGRTENGGEVVFDDKDDFAGLINKANDKQIIFTATDGSSYSVARAEYTASYTYYATNSTAWVYKDAAAGSLALYEQPSEKLSYLPDNTAYIWLSQFYGTAAEEFYRLVEKFNADNCTSLILDLRSNGGGYVKVMQKIAGCFADGESRTAMFSVDKNGRKETYKCEKITDAAQRVSKDKTVYVLADSGTASASEALIGAMICYGALDYENIFLSQYSGEYLDWLSATGQETKTSQTYGKGIMQTPYTNRSTGEVLKLTTAEIFWPDGKTCIHDRGLTVADGCVPVYAEWQHTKNDEQLQKAVEIIETR